ncbi:boophilin-H2-like [Vanessa cardui]|uniref:boophilin-H2-like n=1 Tax=Vanessa cardui TaxID=171605 RepID=UPI001F12A2D6|nr:boophilin-H2-like [Vanessa cardui]
MRFPCVLMSLLYKIVNGQDSSEVTLTTFKLPKTIYPKPTTLYRRINVERNYYEGAATLLDLVRFVDGRRKKQNKRYSYIWNWDHWCHLQPIRGYCKKSLNRFYYDAQLDHCLPFVYTGCDGNKNNFETLLECDRRCKGSIYVNAKHPKQPAACFLQPDTGYCLALISKYYYDINEKTCKKFMYGGCGGNQNKFDTLFSCMRACSVAVV